MPPLSRDPTAAYPISEDTSIPPEERTTLWICSYTKFDNLAHAPRGTPSDHSLHTIHLDERTGALHRHSTVDGVLNPAFLRFHPKGVVYALTESIHENGEIVGFTTDAAGGLSPLCRQSAHGLSTCFLHLTTNLEHVLFVNYWDSSLGVCPVKPDGVIAEKVYLQAPAKVHAAGLADHLANRQSEPHAHAIVVDPTHGRIACVPDLGLDKIRLYTFDPQSGQLASIGELPCCSGPGPHGPRYIEFDRPGFGTHYRHSAKRDRAPEMEAAFVVNEVTRAAMPQPTPPPPPPTPPPPHPAPPPTAALVVGLALQVQQPDSGAPARRRRHRRPRRPLPARAGGLHAAVAGAAAVVVHGRQEHLRADRAGPEWQVCAGVQPRRRLDLRVQDRPGGGRLPRPRRGRRLQD